MRVVIRWVNELRGTTEGEIAGTWDRSTGTASFEEFQNAKLKLHDSKATMVLNDQTLYGYVWSATDEEIVVHITEA